MYNIIWTRKDGTKEIVDMFDSFAEACSVIPEYRMAYNTTKIDIVYKEKEVK